MSRPPSTSQEKLTERSQRLDDYDRRKQEPPAQPKPNAVEITKGGISKLALVLWLCFIWVANLGVITLQIAAMTGTIGLDGPPPTWGEVVEQLLLGLLFSTGLIIFYKFRNRTPRAPLA